MVVIKRAFLLYGAYTSRPLGSCNHRVAENCGWRISHPDVPLVLWLFVSNDRDVLHIYTYILDETHIGKIDRCNSRNGDRIRYVTGDRWCVKLGGAGVQRKSGIEERERERARTESRRNANMEFRIERAERAHPGRFPSRSLENQALFSGTLEQIRLSQAVPRFRVSQ